jgi:hypothetical protein
MLSPTVLLLLVLAAPTEGRWVKLFDEADESTSIQLPSRANGSDAIVWIRHHYKRVQPGGVRSLRDQWHVDCRQRSFTMFALARYDARGRLLSAEAIRAAERRAAPVIPGSRMEQVVKAVCG